MNRVTVVAGILAGAALVVSGCVQRYPMGLTAEEWTALPPEQRANYQAQQYAIDEQRRQEQQQRQRERERLAAEAAAREQERVVAAYDRARYGDIITVNIAGARMYYGKTIWPCQPVSFDLVKSESKQVGFTGYDPSAPSRRLVQQYWVGLSDDGHTFTFGDSPTAQNLVIIDDGWRQGRTYHNLGTPHGPRVDDLDIGGMQLSIRFRDVNDGQRVIIEHR